MPLSRIEKEDAIQKISACFITRATHDACMNRWPALICLLGILSTFTGCLTSKVENSGGPGSITIENTNPSAIQAAARTVFARHGYSPGPARFPESISFDRPAGRTGELMFGSFNTTTSFRVRLTLAPIAETQNIRVMTQVYRVNNADRPGFERETVMLRSWSSQFNSILREIRSLAENANPTPPQQAENR